MEENEANRDADPEKQPRQKKINKVPVVKKAKLLPKNGSSPKKLNKNSLIKNPLFSQKANTSI